jgi:hypothetical protein
MAVLSRHPRPWWQDATGSEAPAIFTVEITEVILSCPKVPDGSWTCWLQPGVSTTNGAIKINLEKVFMTMFS